MTDRASDDSADRPDGSADGDRQADVRLDVPELAVDEVELSVDDLEARLSLETKVGRLVEVRPASPSGSPTST